MSTVPNGVQKGGVCSDTSGTGSPKDHITKMATLKQNTCGTDFVWCAVHGSLTRCNIKTTHLVVIS